MVPVISAGRVVSVDHVVSVKRVVSVNHVTSGHTVPVGHVGLVAFVGLLALLSLLLPSCRTSDQALGHADETVVLAAGNKVVVERREIRKEYGGGDAVHLVVRKGVCTINGIQFLPPPPPLLPRVLPVDSLRREYDQVPMIREYVRSHPGDSVAAWNRASREWADSLRSLYGNLTRTYQRLRSRGLASGPAIESTLAIARDSKLVETAALESPSGPRILVTPTGRTRAESVLLRAYHRPAPASSLMTQGEVKSLRDALKLMARTKVPGVLVLRNGSRGRYGEVPIEK